MWNIYIAYSESYNALVPWRRISRRDSHTPEFRCHRAATPPESDFKNSLPLLFRTHKGRRRLFEYLGSSNIDKNADATAGRVFTSEESDIEIW